MPPWQFSTFQWPRFSDASFMILTILHNFADPNATSLHAEYLITAVTSLMIYLHRVRGIMLSMISGWALIQRESCKSTASYCAVKNGIPTSRCLRWLLVLLTLVHQPRGASDYLQLFNSAQVQQLPSPSPINLLPCVPRPPNTNSHCLIPTTVAASSFQNPSVRLTILKSLCTTVQRHPTKRTFIALHSQQASSITMSTQHMFAIIFHFGLQRKTKIVTGVMLVLPHLQNVTHQFTVIHNLFECNQLTYVCSRSVYILQFTITHSTSTDHLDITIGVVIHLPLFIKFP